MLLYPKADLAFVHVPKNGGKSTRRALDDALDLDLSATSADLELSEEQLRTFLKQGDGVPQAELGMVKLEHLPLVFWKELFPLSWSEFCSLESFVFVREPRDRFLSALLQRLGEFKDVKGVRADDPLVTQEALQVCEWLNAREKFCDSQYIHFTRQIDYVELEGTRIISRIFPIEETPLAAKWLANKIGGEMALSHDHARREVQTWAGGIQPIARYIGRNLMPSKIKKAIYPIWVKSGVFGDAAARYKKVRLDPQVEAFVSQYYAKDFALYREAKENVQSEHGLNE